MTYKSSESLYPDKIDPWIFFQDLSNDKGAAYNSFLSLSKSGEYSAAQKLAHENGIDFFDAELLMCIQNRIYNMQKIIFNKQKPSHHVFDISPIGYKEVPIYSNGELVDISYVKIGTDHLVNNTVWVSSYVGGGPLLTNDLQVMVTDGQIDAIQYEEKN